MRIEASLEIKTVFVYSDTGYTRTMTLPEIEKWAEDKMHSITVLLKEGGTEPKPVRASFALRDIRFVPDQAERGRAAS